MNIKSKLCESIRNQKELQNLTYEGLVEISRGRVVKSQITSILKYGGLNVSVETLEDLLSDLGYSVEVSIVKK